MDCPVCGKPLMVPEAPLPPPAGRETGQPPGAAEIPNARGDAPLGTPWERRAELGFFRGWRETVGEALLEPRRLLGEARLDRGAAQLGFAVLTASAGSAANQVLSKLLFARNAADVRRALEQMTGGPRPVPPEVQSALAWMSGWAGTVSLILLSPLSVLLFLYASAGVTHLFALLLRQNRRGFAATFAAVSYSFAPFVLLAVPGCGGLIAIVWCVVLTGIALQRTHGISPGGAVAAALSPYLLLCCASCAASVLVGIALSRAH